MAGPDSRRIVLSFGPSDGSWAGQVLAALPRASGRLWNISGTSGEVPARLARFQALRLEGETLLAAETTAWSVESVAAAMRHSGAPEFFVLRPESRARGELDGAWQQPYSLRRRVVLAHIRERKLTLDRAEAGLAEAVRLGRRVTETARWIFDNSWLIRAAISELRKDLPPKVTSGASGQKQSDVMRLTHKLVASADCAIEEDNLREYLREAQTECPLTIAELWAFPLFVRVALIDALALRAAREDRYLQLRERAGLWANRLARAARVGRNACARLLEMLKSEPDAAHPDFTAQLAEMLQREEGEPALRSLECWAEERFGVRCSDLMRARESDESARAASTANAFNSLRSLGQMNYAEIFESASVVDAELRNDPAGIYPASDFQTRDQCRRVVERIALHSGLAEHEVARRVTRLAAQSNDSRTRHVAWYLLSGGIEEIEAVAGARLSHQLRILRLAVRHATAVYIGAILLLTASFLALSLVFAWEAGVHSRIILAALAAVAAFTLSELSVEIAHALIVSLLPPETLPRMDYREGIPVDKATLVVVPVMLTSRKAIRGEIGKLEVRFLGNRNENIWFSLFSDFTDSSTAVDSNDEKLLRAAVDGVNELNSRYPGGRFLLFHRPRTWSDSEQAWIGRERKRGKIEDLNAFLCGENGANPLVAGRLPLSIAYVITLDADTQLPLESARRLIETIAHPLNRVVIDPVARVRTAGYAIIQPRVSIALPAATATRFTRIFADARGTDPYCQTVSDAQQDLFHQAIFHGKAIYDVRAFHTILKNRFPRETILSHDLIEGAHAGVGLASDIELFESMPADYGSYTARQRRWIRGDWQIAPWLFPRVPLPDRDAGATPLSTINRWRVLDNLRRSLIPVAALSLLLFGWLLSSAPGIASLVVALAVAIPAFAPLLDRLARRVHGSVRGWQGAADDLKRAAVMITFLPHQAWLAVDSIARVFYRRCFSHRGMLEWQTAQRARVLGRQHLDAAFRQMLIISLLAMVLAVVLVARREWAPAIAFVGLWIAAPLVMRWLAGRGMPERETLRADEKVFLRRAARRTWRYFDDLVGDHTHWLPPDNSQLKLRVEVAQRTSPTNIGLGLVATLAARDFGYLTADEMYDRCARTIRTLSRMERCDTHLLNWYDTCTLAPLNPRYVSTVDCGNLVAALMVFAQGCFEAIRQPVIGPNALRGLSDTLAIVQEQYGGDSSMAGTLRELRNLFRARRGHNLAVTLNLASTLCADHLWNSQAGDERAYWASRLKDLVTGWGRTARRYLSWMDVLASIPDAALLQVGPEMVALRRAALRRVPSLRGLACGRVGALNALLAQRSAHGLPHEVAAWLDLVAAEYIVAQANAADAIERFRALRAEAEDLSSSMDLGILYDRKRRMFGVGYAAGRKPAFSSHYDLLASECRLTSLVAIAKGDVPAEHWFTMSRPWVHGGRGGALLSWSGTMFEYLMPLLFARTFANSLLHRACHNAVQHQIEHGRSNAIPWGISESAHGDLDSHRIYQYRAFGVPALALNPEVGNEPVVAPYATMLAAPLAPRAAVENLRRFANAGLAGPMGFYESIDFTQESKGGAVIGCYMAHHQAMSLAALDNVLHGNIMQRRFHGDPRIRSIETLLCERVSITPMPSEERKLWETRAGAAQDFLFKGDRFAANQAIPT